MLATKEKIGRMDRQITFKRALLSENESFNTMDTVGWQDVLENPTVFCEKVNMAGNEVYEGYQLTGVSSSKFRIRYRTDLTVMNGILFEGLFYEIVSITETTRRRYMEVLAVQKGKWFLDDSGNGFTIGFTIGFRA